MHSKLIETHKYSKKVMHVLMHKQVRQIKVHKVNAFSIKFVQQNSFEKDTKFILHRICR